MKYLTILVLAVLISIGSSPADVLAVDTKHQPRTIVKTEKTEIARRVIEELWNGENIDVAYDVYADSFLAHSPANDSTQYVTPGFWRELVGIDFRRAFPDMHVTIGFISASEDYAAVHYTLEGTFTGSLSATQAATGKLESWDGVFVFRFEDGKIVEEWWYWVNAIM